MKKLLTIILAVLISFASLPVYAFAKDVLDITENRIAEQETSEVTDFAEKPVVYAAASSSGGQWVQESNGRWWYKHADGSYTKYNWEYINGSWYFFDKNGWMWTEWLQWEGNWYYLNPSGVMHTGWLKDDGKQYYFTMRGIMVTGWQVINGAYYYFDSSGAMCTGWIKVNNKWYYMNADGSMRVGWIKLDGNWYYLNTDGSMRTGWIQLENKWYYFNNSGVMLRGVQTIDGYGYYFASDGHMVNKSFTEGKRTFKFYSNGKIKYIKMKADRIKQGKYNWCWAASAAMIGNYENGTSLTMQDVVTNVKGSLRDEGATTYEEKKALRYALPGKEIKTLQKNQIKFDTFAWYANKNHPVFATVQFYTLEPNFHALVYLGYDRETESVQVIDPAFNHPEYIEYSQLMNNFPFKATNGEVYYAETIYIHVYP